jgi:hypothetical protein
MQLDPLQKSIKCQYLAALETLKKVVDGAPDAFLFADRSDGVPPWQVAVHAYWFTGLYLSQDWPSYVPSSVHRAENHLWSPIPWENNRAPEWAAAATRAELQQMDQLLRDSLDERITIIPLYAASGFPWIPTSRLEVHIYNVRHLQHHAAQLISRLRRFNGGEVAWMKSIDG